MLKETESLNTNGQKYLGPSHRAARFILGIFGWIKDIFNPPTTIIPRGRVLKHFRNHLPAGKTIRYPSILLVEDDPNTAQKFIETIENYYVMGAVRIFVAYAYDAAVTFFDNEEINLVIMDADLDDEDGDGIILTRKFLSERPEISILANSSSRISNLKLTGFGAIETLGKSKEKLKSWLLLNDPTGTKG